MSVAELLAAREQGLRRLGGGGQPLGRQLEAWAEGDFVRHASSQYVDFTQTGCAEGSEQRHHGRVAAGLAQSLAWKRILSAVFCRPAVNSPWRSAPAGSHRQGLQ
jgi:hypothetical protein